MIDVKDRGIDHLVHFTNINNIDNIMRHGLLNTQDLKEQNIPFIFTDEYKLDGRHGLSLSVQFPNYKMFYSKTNKSPQNDMVVLLLDPELINEKKCLYFYDNAATTELKNMSSSDLMTDIAWEKMFSDKVDGILRSELKIPNSFTTNPQAEVICLEPIEPKYIKNIICKSDDQFGRVSNYLDIVGKNEHYFNARIDYTFW